MIPPRYETPPRKRVPKDSPVCCNGHQKTPEDYYIGPYGFGICRICRKAAGLKFQKKKSKEE